MEQLIIVNQQHQPGPTQHHQTTIQVDTGKMTTAARTSSSSSSRIVAFGYVALFLLVTFVHEGHGFVIPSPTSSSLSRSKTQRSHIGRQQQLQLSPVDLLDTSLLVVADAATTAASPDYIPGTSGEVTYSRASYYVILGLYLTSFPGLWSVIKRSTSAKVKRKTYVAKGDKAPSGDGKNLREQAGEIMAYMKANNYEVVDAGETITFRGIVQRSTSQAFFLVFCAAVGLASLALVLQIQFQNLGTYGTLMWIYRDALVG
jgi:hypothetical protein